MRLDDYLNDVHTVGEKTHQLTGGKSAAHNHFGAQPADGDNAGVHGEHQYRII